MLKRKVRPSEVPATGGTSGHVVMCSETGLRGAGILLGSRGFEPRGNVKLIWRGDESCLLGLGVDPEQSWPVGWRQTRAKKRRSSLSGIQFLS